MEKQVAILDHDKAYLKRLIEGLNRVERRNFSAVEVGDDLREAALLIISSEVQDKIPTDFVAGEVLILTDMSGYREINHHRTIYKYQGISQIAMQIESFLTATKEIPAKTVMFQSRASFIGIASPIGRSFKTSFALVLGQLLSQRYKVLYVNLEAFCGAECLYSETLNVGISDILYAHHTGEGSLEELYGQDVEEFHGLELLGPVTAPEDLLKTTPIEIRETVRQYAERKGYEYVILDIGGEMNLLEAFFPLLEKLYVPGRKDVLSEAKLKEFFQWVAKNTAESSLDVERLDVPSGRMMLGGKKYLDSLLFSEIGDYVRDMLSRVHE